jgi:hypothetical protein
MQTLSINNFAGGLTRHNDGEINSGLAKYSTTFGNDPFSNPGNLTWFETPTRVDSGGTVITDLIVAARPRLESGITYVYAIGHTGRLYKIQVNDPTTYNPNYDNAVLLATLTASSPTFKYGSSIQFYGATERIYIGHDVGVTRIDFNGTNETLVGSAVSYTTNVPRPSVNFGGVTYWGNGTNIVAIDSTATVTSYTRLSPAFPVGTQVRDMDVSPDGNYIQIVVSRLTQPDLTATTQDTSSLSSADSYFIYWNGIDNGYTSYNPYNSYSLNSNTSFGPFSYTYGYDLGGAAIYSGGQKIISLPESLSPNFAGVFSTGNLVGHASPENSGGYLKGTIMAYGNYDREISTNLYRFLRASASGTETDIIKMPLCAIVSNLFYGSSSAGYASNQIGSAKLYYSTLETSASPTVDYKLYKFTTVPTGLGNAIGGVYETQSQLFSKKIVPKEVRFYVDPLIANNSFQVDLIGSGGVVLSGSTKIFTVGTNVTAGQDYVWYSPATAPTYALGIRITNLGTKNWIMSKAEIDFTDAGK